VEMGEENQSNHSDGDCHGSSRPAGPCGGSDEARPCANAVAKDAGQDMHPREKRNSWHAVALLLTSWY
jgi:hypothetical protein